MRILKSSTLVVGAIVLAFAAQGNAARQASGPAAGVSYAYTVGSSATPGVDTGLVLAQGASVSVTATGTFYPGTGLCFGPNGDPSVDTMHSSFGGFVLPGAPAWGLVGRVGNGLWTQVGSGPTTLSGTGDVVFAVNDDLLGDNSGSFAITVTVTITCWPGNGKGDVNHSHTGPPGQGADACYPGNGYGDKNHDHYGPPGQSSASPSGQQGAAGPSNGKAKGHEK